MDSDDDEPRPVKVKCRVMPTRALMPHGCVLERKLPPAPQNTARNAPHTWRWKETEETQHVDDPLASDKLKNLKAYLDSMPW